jgi:hypothetical protein
MIAIIVSEIAEHCARQDYENNYNRTKKEIEQLRNTKLVGPCRSANYARIFRQTYRGTLAELAKLNRPKDTQ